jgi:hypothetical protein
MRKHASVQMVNEIAHVLTGRSEIKAGSETGLGGLLAPAEAEEVIETGGIGRHHVW